MNVRSCCAEYYLLCFQTQKQLATLNNMMQALLKSVLIDLRTRNFVHAKTSLRARCLHIRHRARNLSSLVVTSFLYQSQHSNGESAF